MKIQTHDLVIYKLRPPLVFFINFFFFWIGKQRNFIKSVKVPLNIQEVYKNDIKTGREKKNKNKNKTKNKKQNKTKKTCIPQKQKETQAHPNRIQPTNHSTIHHSKGPLLKSFNLRGIVIFSYCFCYLLMKNTNECLNLLFLKRVLISLNWKPES
jgi:hypothetical protein